MAKTQKTNGQTTVLRFSNDLIVIPPSASLAGTVGAILRATTLSVDGHPVAGKGSALPEKRLSIAQARAFKAAGPSALRAGTVTLPLAKRGRPSGARGVSAAAWMSAGTSAPRRTRKAASVAPAASQDTEG